jgi:hypothetical protein
MTDDIKPITADGSGKADRSKPRSDDELPRRDQLRRVVIVCATFMRNLAYFRASTSESASLLYEQSHPHRSFWRQVRSNFPDLCVLEWCKLLGDRNTKHFWRRIVTDKNGFEAGLLAHVGKTAAEWESFVEEMRHLRDKFIAHLDSEQDMFLPVLDTAQASISYYHRIVVEHEANAGDLIDLVETAEQMVRGYAQCLQEAEAVYRESV